MEKVQWVIPAMNHCKSKNHIKTSGMEATMIAQRNTTAGSKPKKLDDVRGEKEDNIIIQD